jgi:uncharacterized protein YciI
VARCSFGAYLKLAAVKVAYHAVGGANGAPTSFAAETNVRRNNMHPVRGNLQIRLQFMFIAAVSSVVLASCALDNSVEPASTASAAEPAEKLFAVEIKIGPNWDSAKPPNEQEFFSEHAATLKRLREAGHIVMGARYSDIGLIIFSARSAEEVRALMSQDPSMTAGTFKYEVHLLNVFYPGLVQP